MNNEQCRRHPEAVIKNSEIRSGISNFRNAAFARRSPTFAPRNFVSVPGTLIFPNFFLVWAQHLAPDTDRTSETSRDG